MSVLFALAVLAIGISIGMIGTGGIFLLPLLVFGARMPVETAIGTALLTFVFTGITATALYARRGRIDWRIAGWISIGSAIAGPLGAQVSLALPSVVVKTLLALFLIAVGSATLVRRQSGTSAPSVPIGVLLACGFAVGFGAGLTGVGGPAILVPMLIVIGFPAALAISVSQPNQIVSSLAGATGHALFGHIDARLALTLTVLEVVGVVIGSEIGARVDGTRLAPVAGVASIAAGALTAIRTFMAT